MTKKTFTLPLLVALLALGGCLDGDSGSDDDTETGRLTATGIEGLRYQTASQAGTTNADGEFQYYEGETVSFWLGDLLLASDVPAKPFLTPIDFSAENREQLRIGSTNENGLSTHTLTEARIAAEDAETINITRLLLALDNDKTTRLAADGNEKNNIRITDRVIQQFNQQLAALPEGQSVDFTQNVNAFAAVTPASPITRVLEQVCFYPADDERCDEPNGQSEIDALKAELANRTPGTPEYEEIADQIKDLEDQNRNIENATRYLDDYGTDRVETFLLRETEQINSQLGREFYVTPFEFTIPASDTSLKTINVRSHDGRLDLTALEAIALNPEAVEVHSWSAQTKEVDFFVTGEPGSEGEVRLSFRPDGDYRWYQSQVKPVISD